MKKFMYRFSAFLVIALAAVAKVGVDKVDPLCMFFHYQSEVPASLRK